jgi:glycosyltransferase involved in cell wall biosynthesis
MIKSYLISVIIPVYNGDRFLKQAIESVYSQTYFNVEIILIDDGSTDRTREIATSFPSVIYEYQENKGVASARNKGLEMAKGEFIAFLDADDFYPEDKLLTQLNYLLENPDVIFCLGHFNNFIEPGYTISEIDYDYFINHDKIGLPSLFTHKSVYETVGLFNAELIIGSDFEWFSRAIDAGVNYTILPKVLLNRRIHDSNLSLIGQESKKSRLFRILKDSIERKRK